MGSGGANAVTEPLARAAAVVARNCRRCISPPKCHSFLVRGMLVFNYDYLSPCRPSRSRSNLTSCQVCSCYLGGKFVGGRGRLRERGNFKPPSAPTGVQP